jgi:hypothetical protein
MARKRHQQKRELGKVPGRGILDEDRVRRVALATRRNKRFKRQRGPLSTETGQYARSDVEDRILRAMKTLRALPDNERRFFVFRSGHPPHVQEQIDAYASVEATVPRFRPTPADVSGYLTSLSWVRHLPRNQWQLIWWRSFELSFGLMAKYTGQSDETVRRHYREAVTDAWVAANGLKAA